MTSEGCIDLKVQEGEDYGVPGVLGVLVEAFQLPFYARRTGYGRVRCLLAA